MIHIRIKEILKEKNKSKYWLVNQMGSSYQSLSKLMNEETSGLKFETLERLCEILDCEPRRYYKNNKRYINKKARVFTLLLSLCQVNTISYVIYIIVTLFILYVK